MDDKASVMQEFFAFARAKRRKEADELITTLNLKEEAAKRYIIDSLARGYASENGTGLSDILPALSPLKKEHRTLRQRAFEAVVSFVDKFRGIGGDI